MKALSSGVELILFIIIYAVSFDIHKLVVFAGGQINDILFYSILVGGESAQSRYMRVS
jgi:hypothetical protein